ncbi:hypothetical protein IKL64_01890 [bacterium]|nr:hypothetical protein [bacterium]
MKNLLILGFVLLSIVMCASYVEAVTIVKNENVKNPRYINNSTDMYDYDLDRIERYLFRKTYQNNNLQSRLNRIEKYLFNRSFPNWNNTRRINHILANYRENYNRNYVAGYNYKHPVQRIKRQIVGQPTGFTPSVMDMPFGSGFFNNGIGSSFSPGFSQGFATNRGYGFMNSIPAMTRSAITILD